MHDNLQTLRENIDEIDTKVLTLLKVRFEMTKKIGREKKRAQLEILDSSRESFILSNLETQAKNLELDQSFVTDIWQRILEHSKQIQEAA